MATRRQELERAVRAKKAELWGKQPRYRAVRSNKYVSTDPYGNKPKLELLNWFLTADQEDILDNIKNGGEDYGFLYYR
jgi:hypothetical protein